MYAVSFYVCTSKLRTAIRLSNSGNGIEKLEHGPRELLIITSYRVFCLCLLPKQVRVAMYARLRLGGVLGA